MNKLHYLKALEIIIQRESISIWELYRQLIDLKMSKEESITIINAIMESPMTQCCADLIKISN